MIIYSISDLEDLSGIKAHTLRVWEKRYGLIPAKRTESNIRYYTEKDLQLALNITFLYNKGYKISKLAKMSTVEIENHVKELTEIDMTLDKNLDVLSLAMVDLDQFKFMNILNKIIDQKGFDFAMEEVIYPFLDKISIMWMSNMIEELHEMFVVDLIKQKLIVEIDKLMPCNCITRPKILLFLLPEENHSLSLLYLCYRLRKINIDVMNIGTCLKIQNFKRSCELFNPNFVFTIINDTVFNNKLNEYLNSVSTLTDIKFLISGFQIDRELISNNENIKIIKNLGEVLDLLQTN